MAVLPDHNRHDRRITILVALTAVVVVLIGLGTPRVISTSNTTRKVQQSTELQGCRAQASADVTDARTEFDVARSQRDTAVTTLDLLMNEGLVAAVSGDDPTTEKVIAKLPGARAAVLEAEGAVVEATEHLRQSNAGYQDAITLSRSDPMSFLEGCNG